MNLDQVILVDPDDREIGIADKLTAHVQGQLHRAFSVFVFNEQGELLLQQRHPEKYHSGGLWSNTCCSHPRPGESVEEAAARRLEEEMGLRCTLAPISHLLYRVRLGDLWEHEYDHVLVGHYDSAPRPNPHEVSNWRWAGFEELSADLERHPGLYTHWFRLLYRPIIVRIRATDPRGVTRP